MAPMRKSRFTCEMKYTHLLPSILAVLFIAISAARVLAYDHDDKGWIDNQHQHHPFVQHSGHRGYWDHDKSGARVFINI
jgi:hypothetical protein